MKSSLLTVFFVVLVATSIANEVSINQAPEKSLAQMARSQHMGKEIHPISLKSSHSKIKSLAEPVNSDPKKNLGCVFKNREITGGPMTNEEGLFFKQSPAEQKKFNDVRDLLIKNCKSVNFEDFFKKMNIWRKWFEKWRNCPGNKRRNLTVADYEKCKKTKCECPVPSRMNITWGTQIDKIVNLNVKDLSHSTKKIQSPIVKQPIHETKKIPSPNVKQPIHETKKIPSPNVKQPIHETKKIQSPNVKLPIHETKKIPSPDVEHQFHQRKRFVNRNIERPKFVNRNIERPNLDTDEKVKFNGRPLISSFKKIPGPNDD
jgi:hypothetical protein